MLNVPLKVDAEFKAVCPPLAEEERKELAASIKKDGCREAIRTWRGYIIDGHNRYEICEELHCSYVSREVLGLNSRAEVIAWIIRNQFGRRNLNAMQRAELALKLKEAVAAEAKARKVKAGKEHGRGKEKHPPTLAEPKSETRDELANVAGVSHGTLAKVEKIVTQAAPAVVEAARKGEISINAAFKTVAPRAEQNPSPVAAPVENPAPIPAAAHPAPPSAPVRSMKNWERFKNRKEADAAHAAEKIIFGCGWGEIEWLYMDYIPDEPRADYLHRLEKHGILKSEGFRELQRIEKKQKNERTKR